jgi:hypothetical protein
MHRTPYSIAKIINNSHYLRIRDKILQPQITIFFRNFAPQIRAIGFADILLKAFALFEDSFHLSTI